MEDHVGSARSKHCQIKTADTILFGKPKMSTPAHHRAKLDFFQKVMSKHKLRGHIEGMEKR